MQPGNFSGSESSSLEDLIVRNYDQAQQDMKKLRVALRKLYSKMEQQNALRPIDQDLLSLRSVTPEERVQMIRYVRANIEKFNQATEHLAAIHQDLQQWRAVKSELQEIKEELSRLQRLPSTAYTPKIESNSSQTMVP